MLISHVNGADQKFSVFFRFRFKYLPGSLCTIVVVSTATVSLDVFL